MMWLLKTKTAHLKLLMLQKLTLKQRIKLLQKKKQNLIKMLMIMTVLLLKEKMQTMNSLNLEKHLVENKEPWINWKVNLIKSQEIMTKPLARLLMKLRMLKVLKPNCKAKRELLQKLIKKQTELTHLSQKLKMNNQEHNNNLMISVLNMMKRRKHMTIFLLHIKNILVKLMNKKLFQSMLTMNGQLQMAS